MTMIKPYKEFQAHAGVDLQTAWYEVMDIKQVGICPTETTQWSREGKIEASVDSRQWGNTCYSLS